LKIKQPHRSVISTDLCWVAFIFLVRVLHGLALNGSSLFDVMTNAFLTADMGAEN